MSSSKVVTIICDKEGKIPDDLPKLVKEAVARGAKVDFHPEEFKEVDSCGCCYTIYMPGWYELLPPDSRRFICDVNGNVVPGINVCGIIGSIEGIWNP